MSDDLIRRSDVYKMVDDWLEGRVPNLNIKAIPSADRPQGEWIRTGRTNIYGGIEVQCSNCNDKRKSGRRRPRRISEEDAHKDVPCEFVEEMKGAVNE